MVTANKLQILQSPITGLISSVSTSVSVKLDETNYLQWHFLLQLLLEGHGIMGFVDGSNLCPPQYAATSAHSALQTGSSASPKSDEFKAWKMHDYALMLLLIATLSSSAISCVIGSTSSREMWVRLQNHFFLPSTKTSIIKLQTYLYNMKKGSDSISQFLRRIKEARDGLSVLGVTLTDEDFVLIALNGLPGILGSPPSPNFNSPPPDFPTHQICSQNDHFDDDCYPRHNAQSSVSTPESCQSPLDQQFKLGCPVILQKHETPLQSNSDVEIHTVYDCKSGSLSDFIVSEDEMFLDDVKDQVLECIDNEGT